MTALISVSGIKLCVGIFLFSEHEKVIAETGLAQAEDLETLETHIAVLEEKFREEQL